MEEKKAFYDFILRNHKAFSLGDEIGVFPHVSENKIERQQVVFYQRRKSQ